MGRVVAVGGRDTVLIRFGKPTAAHPGCGRETPIAVGGFHHALLLIVFVGRGVEQEPFRAAPNVFLLESGRTIGGDEFLRHAALCGRQYTVNFCYSFSVSLRASVYGLIYVKYPLFIFCGMNLGN